MKRIPIGTTKFCLVDDEDFKALAQHAWCSTGSGYAFRKKWRGKGNPQETISMHRLLAEAKPSQQVDHINGDRLDNRRANLRICSHQENSRNRKPNKGRTLPKGVADRQRFYTAKLTNRFAANIKPSAREKAIHLGYYPTAEIAALVYDIAAILHFGDFAKTNYPRLEKQQAA